MVNKKAEQSSDNKEKAFSESRVAQRIHAESIGDVWLVLTGRMPQKIMGDVAATVLQAGGSRPVWQWKIGDAEYVLLAWPKEQPVRAAVLLSGKSGEKLNPVTIFPLLEGVPNNLQVDQIHPREAGCGADVAVEILADKNPLWFFDPLYIRDKEDLTQGVTHTFWLAAAALKMRKALLDNFTVTSGAQYEEYAEKWLKDNPGKKSSDVPPLQIEIKDAHMIMPGHHFGEYHVRARVMEVEDWQFEKMPVKAVYLTFPMEGREPLQLVVYASSFVLGGYDPKKGDEIEAYLWLEGRIIDMPQQGAVQKDGESSS